MLCLLNLDLVILMRGKICLVDVIGDSFSILIYDLLVSILSDQRSSLDKDLMGNALVKQEISIIKMNQVQFKEQMIRNLDKDKMKACSIAIWLLKIIVREAGAVF